jgi:hypothetical protein
MSFSIGIDERSPSKSVSEALYKKESQGYTSAMTVPDNFYFSGRPV